MLEGWWNPFNVITVISNRQTPFHRDTLSAKEWYDLVITFGGDPNLIINLPSINTNYAYAGGTALFFSGSLLPHRVPPSVESRLCYIYYMRATVHYHAGYLEKDWIDCMHHS